MIQLRPSRYILAVTGASGMPYAVYLASALADTPDREVHVIISEAAKKILRLETVDGLDVLQAKATKIWEPDDIAGSPASGSWQHDGMIVCPCSMASLAAIANGLASNLILRAADVTLKEKRPLILVPRETPYSRIHLQNMLAVHDAGAIILPPCPGFYARPQTINDLLAHVCGRILDQLHIPQHLFAEWSGDQ
ncbi:MAG: UbiX family flavin prenyltransferase [Desulfoplanes sp.]